MSSIPTYEELKFTKRVLKLMSKSPTSFNVVEYNIKLLKENGFEELLETKNWKLKPGGKYYFTRNLSTLFAFIIPKEKNLECLRKKLNGFMIVASHSDHPCFKLKDKPEINVDDYYTVLNTEPYGGPMYYTWMDRPLTVAGRVFLKTKNGFTTKSIKVDRPLFMIPSLSAHQSDKVNQNGFKANAHVQLRPLFGGNDSSTLLEIICEENDIDINKVVETELFVCTSTPATVWGPHYEYASSRGIDDQMCVFCSLIGLLESEPSESIPIHVVFDNEEIGSSTKQGAGSGILPNTLQRITEALGLSYDQFLQAAPSSFIASADNGHALHPNYPEATDEHNKTYLGEGVLLKFAAGFAYTTDGLSSTIVNAIAKKGNIKIQEYYNKSGIVPGSTLGRFISPYSTIAGADIGLPQLAMHSGYETCSTKDPLQLKNLTKTIYSSTIKMEKDGNYTVK